MNMRFYRPAEPADGLRMLRLIESHPVKGGLRFLHTRRADAFKSYRTECPDADITVCIDGTGELLGQIVALPRRVYIDGRPETVNYVTDMFKAKGVSINLLKMLDIGHSRAETQKYFCAFPMAETGKLSTGKDGTARQSSSSRHTGRHNRSNAPYDMFMQRGIVKPVCDYSTYFFSPAAGAKYSLTALKNDLKSRKKNKQSRSLTISSLLQRYNLKFRRATPGDAQRLTGFYREEGKNYSYFPVFKTMNDYPGLSVTDFYLLEDDEGIVAAGALWNRQALRQLIPLGYSGLYKAASYSDRLTQKLGYPPLPELNKAADVKYISFLLCCDDDFEVTSLFIGEISRMADENTILAAGSTDGAAVARVLSGIKHFSHSSKICICEYNEYRKKPGKTKPGAQNTDMTAPSATPGTPAYPCRFECALL